MSPEEQTRRARFAIVDAVGLEAPREAAYLLAVVEATAGLCPRNGRVILGALVRAGALSRPSAGMIGRGERYATFAAERAAYLGDPVVRRRRYPEAVA